MALLTARGLKERETPEFRIDLGGGEEVLVRRPDLQLMVLSGMMPTPLFNGVIKLVGEWVGRGVGELTEAVIESNDKILQFVNMFMCEAMLEPRVVMDDVPVTDDATLHVSDLTIATRKRIVAEITLQMQRPQKEVVASAAEFPEREPGAGAGQDVPPLPAAAVAGA